MERSVNGSSSSGLEPASSKVVSEEWPLKSRKLDEICVLLGEIAARPGAAQAVHIYPGSRIEVERMVSPSDDVSRFVETTSSTLDLVRNNAGIAEYPDSHLLEPSQLLFEVMLMLSIEKLEPNRLLVQRRERLRSWLDIPEGVGLEVLFGIPVEEDPAMPEDVFLMCGAMSRMSPARDIQLAVKGVIR